MSTTSRDIALAAGVSQTTVSRVLQGSPKVSPEARSRVLAAMSASGYRPNAMARAMRTSRTGMIGVIVARITNPFYPQLLDSIARVLLQRDYRTVVWDVEAAGEQAAIDAYESGLVDGLVHAAVTSLSKPLQALLDGKAPIVLVNRTIRRKDCDQVSTDNAFGARLVCEHLLSGGKQRLAMICGPKNISTFRDRERGFKASLRAGNIHLKPEHIVRVTAASYRSGYDAMQRLLEHRKQWDAVFCANDAIAFGALDASRSAQLRVPEDLWIVGYDDVDMAAWDAFRLTSMRQPINGMAQAAVKMLLARLEEPKRPFGHLQLPAELMIRQSSGGENPADDLATA